MAQSTLTSGFRTKLFEKFLEGYSQGTPSSVGNAHFIVRAIRQDTGGAPGAVATVAQSFIPRLISVNQSLINYVIQDHYQVSTLSNGNVKLTYTGDPVELEIPIATTIIRLDVVLRERLGGGTSTNTGIDATDAMEFTTVATFPVNVQFTEPNGTLVVNQLEFEIGDE